MTIEITYTTHRQRDETGQEITDQFKYSISATFDGVFMSTFSFFGDDDFALSQIERIKSAIESGKVTISLEK